MEARYPERHCGYQLSLYNFTGARNKLSGIDELVKYLLEKSSVGYNVTPEDFKPDYYITSTYDAADLLEKLKAMDNMQLGYLHHILSNSLRKREIRSEFEHLNSIFITNAERFRLEKAAYKKIAERDFQRPIIIEDFDNNTEYGLEKSLQDGTPTYKIESKKKRNLMEDKYIDKGNSPAINHYYDFSELPREEADLIWDIFNAKIAEK